MSLYNIFLNFSPTCIFSSSMQHEPAGNIDLILMTKTQMKFQTSFASDYIIFLFVFYSTTKYTIPYIISPEKTFKLSKVSRPASSSAQASSNSSQVQICIQLVPQLLLGVLFSLRFLFGDLLLNLDIGFNFRISILVFLEDCGDSSQSSILFLKFFNLTLSEQAGYSK